MSCCRRGTSGSAGGGSGGGGGGGAPTGNDWAEQVGYYGTYGSSAAAQAAVAAADKPAVTIYRIDPGIPGGGCWTRNGSGVLTNLDRPNSAGQHSGLDALFRTKAEAEAFCQAEGNGTAVAYRDDGLGVIGGAVKMSSGVVNFNEVNTDGT